jgi:hypothetical protein
VLPGRRTARIPDAQRIAAPHHDIDSTTRRTRRSPRGSPTGSPAGLKAAIPWTALSHTRWSEDMTPARQQNIDHI